MKRLARKSLWVRADWADPWAKKQNFVTAALEAGAEAVLVLPEEAKAARAIGALNIVASEPAEDVDIVMLSTNSAREVEKAINSAQNLKQQGKRAAIFVEVADKATEQAAMKAGKAADFLIVVGKDWKIIPLENLIAELHRGGAKIIAGVKDADEARTAVQTLEIGADGVLLDPREKGVGEIKKTGEVLEKLAAEKLELVPARVVAIRPVGMGDRACVDTCSTMRLGEGMLVGSQASGTFLVHSETLPSEFVGPRPFRVNAGAVHAYIRLPGGKTKYMSELGAGDEVLIVNAKGEASTAVVGRVKIERRPLLLVEAEREGQVFKTLLQNAETINLVGRDGAPISVTKLKPGDEVLLHIERGGRHFGVKVEETVVER